MLTTGEEIREFLSRPVLEVAPRLLGALIRHDSAEGSVTVRLTEVEAYHGVGDPGSHAFRGETPRTAVMFGPAAHLYVYFTYGMHWCANVVTGTCGSASAVLLRAGVVVDGVEVARRRRPAARTDRDLARGPARLASALGLARAQNGVEVHGWDDPADDSAVGVVRLSIRGRSHPKREISCGPRVGVSGAGGDPDRYPWRFWLTDDPSVSQFRPGKPRSERT